MDCNLVGVSRTWENVTWPKKDKFVNAFRQSTLVVLTSSTHCCRSRKLFSHVWVDGTYTPAKHDLSMLFILICLKRPYPNDRMDHHAIMSWFEW